MITYVESISGTCRTGRRGRPAGTREGIFCRFFRKKYGNDLPKLGLNRGKACPYLRRPVKYECPPFPKSWRQWFTNQKLSMRLSRNCTGCTPSAARREAVRGAVKLPKIVLYTLQCKFHQKIVNPESEFMGIASCMNCVARIDQLSPRQKPLHRFLVSSVGHWKLARLDLKINNFFFSASDRIDLAVSLLRSRTPRSPISPWRSATSNYPYFTSAFKVQWMHAFPEGRTAGKEKE